MLENTYLIQKNSNEEKTRIKISTNIIVSLDRKWEWIKCSNQKAEIIRLDVGKKDWIHTAYKRHTRSKTPKRMKKKRKNISWKLIIKKLE